MAPNAPAAAPITSNTNLPYGGGQTVTDQQLGNNILSFLPTQEQQSATTSNQGSSILPSVNISTPLYSAPTAPTINPASYGTNLTGYNAAVQGAETGLTAQENAEYNQALQGYQSNVNQFGNLSGVYNTLASDYNIPGYQQDVVGLQGLLQNLNQDVNSQTTLGGGLMTESARDESYANRAQPLNMALANAGQELSAGQTDVNNLLNAYETSFTNELKPEELDLSNLPTLFGQTNQAAQTGYGQGQSAIEDVISNQLQSEQVAAEQEQASAAEKQANVLAGEGNPPLVPGATNTSNASGQATYGLKVANNPGAGYYFEDANGSPINAVQYAQATNTPILQVIQAMANSGDTGAKQMLQQVTAAQDVMAPGTDINQYISQNFGNF